LRTEFLFTEEAPSFEAQKDAYSAIFSLFDDVTVRTLDVGGDKALPYIDLPQESNPFLGIRGVRLFKTHPQIIETQLRAVFEAANGKETKVMFPMVATVEEFTEAKAFAKKVAEKYHCNISNIRFGIMVEVPSVLFLMQVFNKVVDFYSIGTNDLNQYLFAIERTHPSLTLDPRSKVLFGAVAQVVKESNKPVSICGELAGDTQATARLVNMGIETLSLSPKRIAALKETIRHV
jgi:phosphocarrier protein FPr